ncbi:MAG: hypothetical protein K2J69_00635 [Malacoplasma sp.]|nr:hypothetical protein [Malacoplasma sp.]
MKKRKLFLTSLLALPVLASPLMVNSVLKNDSDVSLVDQKLTATTSSGLVNLETDTNQNGQVSIPSNYYKQNSINTLANSNGPILLFDDAKTFGATDWYGNPAWYIHLNANDGYYSSYWYTTSSSSSIDFSQAGTKVVDWDYNYETDNLYVLTDTSYLIIITSKTGTIVSATKISDTVNKVEIIKFNSTVYLWNSESTNPEIFTVDSKTGVLSNTNITNSSWSNKYLIGLIPLDVNYSVGVFSSTKVSDTSSSQVNLEMKFIDDSLVDLNASVTGNTINLTSVKASEIYISGFARTSDFVIFIGNKIYSVSLNKSVITESKFTNLLNGSDNTNLNGFSISNNVNSAFIDKNNQIYFKNDNSSDFNYISISNQFTKVTISTTGTNTVFSANNVNSAQVFPVPMTNANQIVSWEYTGYVLSPTDFTGTGFKNSSLLTQRYTSTSRSPMFRIDGTNTSSIPSVIQSSNLVTNQTALTGFALDNSNATIIADDITGYAFIRVPYIIRGAWYGDAQTTASGYLISRFKYVGVATVTTWVSQSNFANIFGSYETNQIDETMLKKQATSIISVPQSILSQANNNLDINFIIVSRTANTGKITLNATISYTNSYGSAISYAMNKQQEYTIAKQAAAYSFMFAGADNNFNKINVTDKTTKDLYDAAQTEIKSNSTTTFFSADVISLGSTYTDYANTLPSLWQVEGISKFITKNDKYPSNAVIEVLAADDEIGSIIILVSYNNLSNSTPSKFAIKYTGIVNYSTAQVQFAGNNNTDSLYTQKFNDNNIKVLTSVQGFADYTTKLSSDVTAGALSSLYTTQLIQYMGFTPKVSIVNNQENDKEGYSSLDMEYGSVYLKLDFTNTESSVLLDSKEEKVVFPTILYDKMGLKNGVIYQRYIGMLPIGETYGITINQERERQLIFANNVNAEFIPSQIRNILDVKGYDVAAGDTINIDGYSWNGEILIFYVSARSKTYESVRIDHKEFQVNWAPKFANIRQTSLIVAVITSLVGITLVALGVSLYIVRRNKIRKLLK